MSTRVSRSPGRFLSNVAILALVSVAAAACSENYSRFDNLFTGSTTPPQRIDQLGESGQQFNARSINQVHGYGGGLRSRQTDNVNSAPNNGLRSLNTPNSNFSSNPSIGNTAPSGIARQSLPPVQAGSKQTRLNTAKREIDHNRGRLTLEEARAINDQEDNLRPLLERSSPRQGNLAAVSEKNDPPLVSAREQRFATGTEWTRKYSPLPTQSPNPRAPNASFGGPSAYTPPQGTYTANIDNRATGAIRAVNGPKIIRSSVSRSVQFNQAKIDNTATATVHPQNGRTSKNGWSSAGGTYVTLSQGETLYSLSRRYGVPVNAIAQSNNISNASSVRAGQQILIPTYVYSPSIRASSSATNKEVQKATHSSSPTAHSRDVSGVSQPLPPAQTAANRAGADTYVVQKGDSLSQIAYSAQVPIVDLRAANGLQNSDVIRIGQTLKIPGNNTSSVAALPRLDRSVQIASVSSSPARTAVTPRSRPNYEVRQGSLRPAPIVENPVAKPLRQVQKTERQRVALPRLRSNDTVQGYTPPRVVDPIVTATAPKVKKTATTKRRSFKWPVRGQIISKYGRAESGTKNDGINIKVPKGTPVRAAAGGEVIYASNGLQDYGNLILIKHSNGYISAYAHNNQLTVRRGQKVRQGQIVAKSGQTGSVTSPQVHFEIRKGKNPVDPLLHLQS